VRRRDEPRRGVSAVASIVRVPGTCRAAPATGPRVQPNGARRNPVLGALPDDGPGAVVVVRRNYGTHQVNPGGVFGAGALS
jgi:hypothetical protein